VRRRGANRNDKSDGALTNVIVRATRLRMTAADVATPGCFTCSGSTQAPWSRKSDPPVTNVRCGIAPRTAISVGAAAETLELNRRHHKHLPSIRAVSSAPWHAGCAL